MIIIRNNDKYKANDNKTYIDSHCHCHCKIRNYDNICFYQ